MKIVWICSRLLKSKLTYICTHYVRLAIIFVKLCNSIDSKFCIYITYVIYVQNFGQTDQEVDLWGGGGGVTVGWDVMHENFKSVVKSYTLELRVLMVSNKRGI